MRVPNPKQEFHFVPTFPFYLLDKEEKKKKVKKEERIKRKKKVKKKNHRII